MKKLIYLIIAIAVLGLIVPGCIPVVPPVEQNEPEILPNKNPALYVGSGGYSTIQEAINAATIPGEIIIVAAGIYPEQLNISNSLSIIGESRDSVTINASSFSSGYGISVTANNVTLEYFTLEGPTHAGGYGIHTSGCNNITFENLLVKNSGRSGVDFIGCNGITVNNVEAKSNGGAGIAITDSNNATLSNITTSDNAWAGMAVFTHGQYYTGGCDDIALTGTNSFGEPYPFYTQTGNFSGGTDYLITNLNVSNYFQYIMRTPLTYPYKTKTGFFPTLDYALSAAVYAVSLGATDAVVNDVITETPLDDYDTYYVGPVMIIQSAINAASSGDTIIVGPGSFSGFTDDKGLDIRGAKYNIDAAETLSRGSETEITGPVKITADNASVNGFKMTGGSYIEISYASYSALNVNVSYNILENTTWPDGAVDLNGENRCAGGYIGYNTISGASGDGIQTIQNDNVTIEYNHILNSSGSAAINAGYHSGDGIVIYGNTITTSIGKGIRYWAGNGGVIIDNVITNSTDVAIFTDVQVTISGNQILGGGSYGIQVYGGADGTMVTGNTISNPAYEGIQSDVPVTITYNDISGGYNGIQLSNTASGSVIDGNNIHDNDYWGLSIQPSVTIVTVTNNQLTDNPHCGVIVWGDGDGSGIQINFNGISGNGIYGVESKRSTSNVDATRNWWGHASGPSGEYGRVNKQGKVIGKGDAVSDYVNWDPWLSQPTVPPTQILNKWNLEGTFEAHPGYNWGLADGATWNYSIHIKEAMNGDFSVGSIHFSTGDIEVTGIVEQTKNDYAYWSESNLAAAGRAEYDGITYNFFFLFSKRAIWFAISEEDLEPLWTYESVWGARAYQLHSKVPDESFIMDPKYIH